MTLKTPIWALKHYQNTYITLLHRLDTIRTYNDLPPMTITPFLWSLFVMPLAVDLFLAEYSTLYATLCFNPFLWLCLVLNYLTSHYSCLLRDGPVISFITVNSPWMNPSRNIIQGLGDVKEWIVMELGDLDSLVSPLTPFSLPIGRPQDHP